MTNEAQFTCNIFNLDENQGAVYNRRILFRKF